MNTKIQELKDLIKAKANYQKTLKQNRKTVHFTGERLMSPSKATEMVERMILFRVMTLGLREGLSS